MTILSEVLQKEDNQRKRLYSLAKKKGLGLQLYRRGDQTDPDYRTYRLVDRDSGVVVHAVGANGYGLTLEKVQEYLTQAPAEMTAPPTNSETDKDCQKPVPDDQQQAQGTTVTEPGTSPAEQSGR